MKKRIILLYICISPCLLLAQRIINEDGKNVLVFDSIGDRSALEEKINLTDNELRVLTGTVCEDSTVFEISSLSDTLKINGEKYILIYTPLNALYEKNSFITYGTIDLGWGWWELTKPHKRYVLEWTVRKDSLYITDYNMASGYQGEKTREDIRKDIEAFWGKKFQNGELKVDWMVHPSQNPTIIDLYVVDTAKKKVYSLRFENGRFIEMEYKSYITFLDFWVNSHKLSK